MGRFLYDGNGRQLNREIDISLWDDEVENQGQPMEISTTTISGHGDRLEKTYMTLAGAIMSRMKVEKLDMRKLASGLLVYTTERNARLEPGIEATMPPEDVVAFNYENFFTPPAGTGILGHEHTLWVAQSLIDWDFGVQSQKRRRESRDY